MIDGRRGACGRLLGHDFREVILKLQGESRGTTPVMVRGRDILIAGLASIKALRVERVQRVRGEEAVGWMAVVWERA